MIDYIVIEGQTYLIPEDQDAACYALEFQGDINYANIFRAPQESIEAAIEAGFSGAIELSTKLFPSDLHTRIQKAAEVTAKEFVDEFGKAWNDETDGDWDAVAFEHDYADVVKSKFDLGALESLAWENCWEVWRESFQQATKDILSALSLNGRTHS